MKWLLLLALLSSPCFGASSEQIIPPTDPQTVHCMKKLEDHLFIAQVIVGGTKRPNFELFVNTHTKLTPERRASLLKLINEAYTAKDLTIWINAYWLPCMKEQLI